MTDKGFTRSIFERLRLERYFSAWLILGLDIAVSTLASAMGLLLYDLAVARPPAMAFHVGWTAGAAAASQGPQAAESPEGPQGAQSACGGRAPQSPQGP